MVKWRQVSLAGCGLLLAALIFAQGEEKGGLTKTKAPAIKVDNGHVTLPELYATIAKVELGLRRVVLSSSQAPVVRQNVQDRVAKRSEITAEFWRLFQLAKPYFKFTPKAVVFKPNLLSIPATDPQRKPLETLIRFGFIGKVAPLATNAAPSISITEYGDALGFFIARMSDLTHTPSAKWSPYMFGHKDG